jgi:hypothetical protein
MPSREYNLLAEQMIWAYGVDVLHNRNRVVEWLEDNDLPAEESDAIAFEHHMRWLIEE